MRRWPRALAAVAAAAALLAATVPRTAAALPASLDLRGYLRDTPLLWQAGGLAASPGDEGGSRWQATNLLHARLNLRWYADPAVTVGVESKLRLFSGAGARDLAAETDRLGGNRGWFHWDTRFVDTDHQVMIGTLDRTWVDGTAGPVELTVGRQRVAWGTALVWNPVDLFNAASPLDFDNVEKPGTDAARVQVYLGPNTKAEVAAAPARRADDATAAAELVLNRWGYDWVLLGGRRGPETVAGGAWAGSIGGGGFRGEVLGAFPRAGYRPPPGLPYPPGVPAPVRDGAYLTGTVDGDYTFHSSLYLHGAVLYNSAGAAGAAGGLGSLAAYARRWLSPARWSVFAEAGHDLSPLVHAGLASILNPGDGSWYLGPSLDWSAGPDLDVTCSGLVFGGVAGSEFGDAGTILLARVQYAF